MAKLKLYVQIFIAFFKISLFTFGGGFAMLPLLNHEVVKKRGWITEDELTDIFTMSQIVPGLIYVSSSTFIGYKVGGIIGAFAATTAVLVPASLAILVLMFMFKDLFKNRLVEKAFRGIIIGVSAMMFSVVLIMIKRTVTTYLKMIVFLISFVLLQFAHIKPYLIILFGITLGTIYSYIINKNRGTDNA